jgi:hypothetical protein
MAIYLPLMSFTCRETTVIASEWSYSEIEGLGMTEMLHQKE